MSTVMIAGYTVERRATFIGSDGDIFVARSLLPGRPWLRFLRKVNGDGYHVTAYRTRALALEGWPRLFRGSLINSEEGR